MFELFSELDKKKKSADPFRILGSYAALLLLILGIAFGLMQICLFGLVLAIVVEIYAHATIGPYSLLKLRFNTCFMTLHYNCVNSYTNS